MNDRNLLPTLLLSLLPSLTCAGATAQRQLHHFRFVPGEMGRSVAGVGDLNRDGTPDYAIGSPTALGDRGNVSIFSGARSVSIRGALGNPGERFGFSVASIGDIDRDGVPDWAAGGIGNRTVAGVVRVDSGARGFIRAHTGDPGGQFGFAIAGIGDIDGDGTPDYAVGQPVATTRLPFASVSAYSGLTGARIFQLGGGNAFGAAIVGVGDQTGDGTPDFAVGASGSQSEVGRVTIFNGRTRSTFVSLSRGNTGAQFGFSLARLEDDGRDGRPELLIGAPGEGAVYLFSAAIGTRRVARLGPAVGFGVAIAGLDDLNLDGVPDFVVGSPRAVNASSQAVGAVEFFNGSTLDRMSRFDAPSGSAGRFGAAISAIGDIEGDGIGEILVGAPGGAGEIRVLTYDFPGRSTRFGIGCRGSVGVPTLTAEGSIAIGQAPTLLVENVLPSAGGFLLVGESNQTLRNMQLPFALNQMGAPGCLLYTSIDMILPMPADAAGLARYAKAIPAEPRLVGSRMYVQHHSRDASSNAAGFVLSNALELLIGY